MEGGGRPVLRRGPSCRYPQPVFFLQSQGTSFCFWKGPKLKISKTGKFRQAILFVFGRGQAELAHTPPPLNVNQFLGFQRLNQFSQGPQDSMLNSRFCQINFRKSPTLVKAEPGSALNSINLVRLCSKKSSSGILHTVENSCALNSTNLVRLQLEVQCSKKSSDREKISGQSVSL